MYYILLIYVFDMYIYIYMSLYHYGTVLFYSFMQPLARTKATNFFRQLEILRSVSSSNRQVGASDPSGFGRFNEWWQWVSKRVFWHILGRTP